MDRLPEENGDDPQGLTRQAAPPRPGGGAQDAMALLRQASQYHQAKQGNVSTPEIEANKQAMAANSEALHALKYSVHGIPEGINHVDELERLKGLINTNQATANDLDNFITLEQFMKDQTARTNGEMGGSSGSELHGSDGAIGVGVPHSEDASAGAASAQAAPAPVPSRRNVQSGGSNGPVSRPHVSGVGEVQAPAPVQRPGMEGRNGRQTPPKADAKPAAKPAVEPPKKRELIGWKETSGSVGGEGKSASMKTIAGRDTGKTNEQGMRVIGAPEGTVKPYQAPANPARSAPLSGPRVPYESPSGRAYQETVAQMAPQALMGLMGVEAARAGLPVGKMAERVETELMPGMVNAGRKLTGKMGRGPKAPSLGEPTMRPATGKAPAIMQEGAPQVGPRPEPRKISVDMSPKAESPSGPKFTRPSAPKRTEGYSTNTQTPAAVKRNSMNKSQRAADANKKGAAEAKTEKTAGKLKASPTKKLDSKKKK